MELEIIGERANWIDEEEKLENAKIKILMADLKLKKEFNSLKKPIHQINFNFNHFNIKTSQPNTLEIKPE